MLGKRKSEQESLFSPVRRETRVSRELQAVKKILELLFGLLKADQMIGKRVKVTGWYRRGPSPYIEVRNAQAEGGEGFYCYWYLFQIFTAGAIIGVGALLGLTLGAVL